ncbi:glycolipid 2-alpha-mannosyltransferase-domain-containing protein [Sporodiniella umbellata]|nr:glycolipid 2-alpha-mannosyltransferase-domain-containing protein [Sporodiniella umbellata]
MGIRRYSWFILQISVAAYVLGSLFYYFGRHTNFYKSTPASIATDNFANNLETYTVGPPYVSDGLTVTLPASSNTTERQRAAFIVLVRNSELGGMLQSMRDVEDRFNQKFKYPWIFLNEEPFTNEFIASTTLLASSKTHYGLVNETMWGYPSWIDQQKAALCREQLSYVPYGLSESYRHMCRFQSGFFWRHPLVLSLNLEYYWRVEPDVRYYCELDYDPFLYMKKNNKKYAFNISFKEHGGTIATLWEAIRKFTREATLQGKNFFPNLATDSLYRFVTDEEGKEYNLCHFWTNFEIARLDLWHTEAYQALFSYLDQTGGFFYERWGTLPFTLFLQRSTSKRKRYISLTTLDTNTVYMSIVQSRKTY